MNHPATFGEAEEIRLAAEEDDPSVIDGWPTRNLTVGEGNSALGFGLSAPKLLH
jgi:hypothetical protein